MLSHSHTNHVRRQGTHIQLAMLDAVVSFEWAEAFARETFVTGEEVSVGYCSSSIHVTDL
jgi:hypothetical protein